MDILQLKTGEDATSGSSLTTLQEEALKKAHALLGFHAAAAGYPNYLDREDLKEAISSVTNEKPTETLLDSLISRYSSKQPFLSLDEFRSLLTGGVLHPEHEGRYWVAVSLAEAETIRRILHLRQSDHLQKNVIRNATTEVALRYSPVSAPNAPSAGDGGVIFDASPGWSGSHGTGATRYEAAVAHNCMRFFDCDMHYSEAALNILVRVLKGRQVHCFHISFKSIQIN